MKRQSLLVFLFSLAIHPVLAQKIIPLTYKGNKYEAIDMTSSGKITWGGYEKKVPADAANSESNGSRNTEAIVAAVGNNDNFEGKPYAAKLCSELVIGNKDDWYLPAKEEADALYAFKEKFMVGERASIWTSTEANANQAVTKYWYTGNFYNNMKVDGYNFICMRKVD